MGHKITLIAPAYDEADRKDKSLRPFYEKIILIDSVKKKSHEEIETLHKKLNRPRHFLTGDGGYDKKIENALKSILKEKHFDAIIAEYSMAGQYIESTHNIIPKNTLIIISSHECYTRAFELRAKKGEHISKETIKELKKYEFKMYNSADKILTLTKEDANILISYEPKLKNKINVVPHGVNTNFYTPPKKKSIKNTKNILYVGNFQHYPNVDAVHIFINCCWDKILQEVPSAKFYAIGFSPPKELIDLRSDNVIIHGGGDDKAMLQFFWNSDVFVAPIELGTGFRGKILEAMACGLPIVATSRATFGINPINGKDMFITDDYETFSKYVIKLSKNDKLRKKIALNGLTLVKKFDHIYAAKKLEKLLKKGKR